MHLKYYHNLDGVRGTAALMIIVFHFFQGVSPGSTIQSYLIKLSVFGQTGVTLFFVLSGFLITRILLATKGDGGYFQNFYFRRALRIFPLYYFFLLLIYFIVPVLSGTQSPPFSKQWFYYVYLQNFASTFNWDAVGPGHFWSLAVEEHFYLFWPLLVFLFGNKSLMRIIIFILLGAVALRLFMISKGYPVFYFTFTRMDSLAMGALLALLEVKGFLKKDNAPKILLTLFILMIPTVFIWTRVSGSGNFIIQSMRDSIESSIYFLSIAFLLCIPADRPINRLLSSPVFSYTGRISYGLYVYHPLAYLIVRGLPSAGFLTIRFIEGIVLTYTMASISYYFLELRFLKLKKKFQYA